MNFFTFSIFRFCHAYMLDVVNVYEKLSIFRHIQLLATLCNEIQQKVVIPIMMIGTIIAVAVGLSFAVHTPITSGNLPVLVILMIGGVDSALFLIFGLGGLAQVYKESSVTFEKITTTFATQTGRKLKWARRYLRSCAPIKMKFGGNNFVDEVTPLNCISHAIQLSVQILLLWNH